MASTDAVVHRVEGKDAAIVQGDDGDNTYRLLPVGDTFDLTKNGSTHGGFRRPISAKTAAYTCTVADCGTMFTTRGAGGSVTFTLPAVATSEGVWYEFYVASDNEVIIAAPDEDLMAFNDLTADSFSFTQASEHIGGCARVVCDGASWLLILSLGAEAQTTVVNSA